MLFNTQPAAFQKSMFGGAEVQLLKTKESLEGLGVNVSIFNPGKDKVEDFDIFHNFSMQRDSFRLFSVAKGAGVKTALSSIYWPPDELIFSDEKLKGLGRWAYEKLAMIQSEMNPFYQMYPYKGYLQMADIILPNSETEKKILIQRFGVPAQKIFVVPNGVDNKFAHARKDLFVKKFKMKDFVLFVGRIDPRKNLLKLILAVKKIGLPMAIVGHAPSYEQGYAKMCKEAAEGSQIYFLGSMPAGSEMLMSAYASAKVLALPSWYETPGLVALEAALAGCSIAITDRGSTRDYFGDMAFYCNPRSEISIGEAVQRAFAHKNRNNLRKHVLANFTWDMVAKKTLEAYQKI